MTGQDIRSPKKGLITTQQVSDFERNQAHMRVPSDVTARCMIRHYLHDVSNVRPSTKESENGIYLEEKRWKYYNINA